MSDRTLTPAQFDRLLDRFETAEQYIRLRDLTRLLASVDMDMPPNAFQQIARLEQRLDELRLPERGGALRSRWTQPYVRQREASHGEW